MSEENQQMDTKLMLRFTQGDDTAFTELMERNFPYVMRTIQRFVANFDDAEDITQEVFLRVYNSRKNYVPSAHFRTWIYHIISNLCINHIRDHLRHRMDPLVYESDSNMPQSSIPDSRQESPSHWLIRQEAFDKVKEALLALPPKQRLAVILAKYEDLSYQEIAEAMDTTPEAVKSLLNRARINLRDLLLKKVQSKSDFLVK